MGIFDFLAKKEKKEESWEETEAYTSEDYEEDDGEALSVYDAAQIWASNGKDEDYMFGYSRDELENAL